MKSDSSEAFRGIRDPVDTAGRQHDTALPALLLHSPLPSAREPQAREAWLRRGRCLEQSWSGQPMRAGIPAEGPGCNCNPSHRARPLNLDISHRRPSVVNCRGPPAFSQSIDQSIDASIPGPAAPPSRLSSPSALPGRFCRHYQHILQAAHPGISFIIMSTI